MGIQSAVMAEQFGTMFQYGKRRISAMSNEEFNALTPQKMQERMTTQLKGMIPEMEQQIQAMRPLAVAVLKEFGAYITEAGGLVGETLAHGIGTHIGHDTPGGTTVPSPPRPTPQDPSGGSGRTDTGKTARQKLEADIDLTIKQLEKNESTAHDRESRCRNKGGTINSRINECRQWKKIQATIDNQLAYILLKRKEYKERYGVWY